MARLRAPRFRGTLLSLAAGVAFSVSPILIQVAYSHGAAVSGVLAWRYLAAALLLAGLAGRKMLSVPLRAAVGAFGLGAVVYALDSALFFGALERTSAPLASLVHYAHLVLVVGVAAMIGRERLTRRRLVALVGIFGGVRSSAGRQRALTASASRWRSAPPAPTRSTSCSPTGCFGTRIPSRSLRI